MHDHLRSGITSQQIFLTGVDQTDGPMQLGNHGSDQWFKQRLFAAKATADGDRLDMDLSLRQIERFRDGRAYGEQALSAGPDYQVMRGVAGRDGDRQWFHIGLVDGKGPVGALDDLISLAQPGLDITD